ncbi:MAG: hypothetical protein OEM26_07190, partial [Saprospiraceae bacterium]|nr:hypothetical protein [Saprospiraceae bacterium]
MAKISSARDTSGTTHNGDNDSSFDMNFSGNPGGAPGTLADDFVGGIGTGEPGSGDPRGDADSHDPAFFLVPVSVGDTTFIDTDLNGLQDPTDPPLPNVTVTLFQIDPATGIGNPVTTDAFGNVYDNTRTTNANGAYLFDSLPHGRYYVVFDVSTASNANLLIPTIANANGSSLDPDDSDPQTMGISDTTGYLYSNEADRTLDAGWWFPYALGDTAFVDQNLNGRQDPSDPGLEGVIVTVYDVSTGAPVNIDAFGNIYPSGMMDTTDQDGYWIIDSLPSNRRYYVVFDVSQVPDGLPYLPTLENVGDTIGDSDINSQGISDTTEILSQPDTIRTLDAGFFAPVVIGDTAFVDVNFDGRQDPGDLPLEGVIVTLYDAATGAVVTMDAFGNNFPMGIMDTTDVDGFWLMDSLPPGRQYYVVFDASMTPDGQPWEVTMENIGDTVGDSDINLLGVSDTTMVLLSADTNRTLDAGYFVPVSIGDTVFVDVDYDGRQDAGDQPLEGVIVTLYDAATGTLVDTDAFGNVFPGGLMDTTDANGFWFIDSLAPNREYYVVFDARMTPDGIDWIPTKENVGDTIGDSDINTLGFSDTTGLTISGDTIPTLDAGYFVPVVIGDTAWVDLDLDGQQEPGEPGLEGIIVTLLHAADSTPVTVDAFGNVFPAGMMDTTDANGFYLLDSLIPGDYIVFFDLTMLPGMPPVGPTLQNVPPDDEIDSDVSTYGYSDPTGFIPTGDTILTIDAGFVFPEIKLAKAITAIEQAASGVAGNLDVTFKYTIHNTGGTYLDTIDLQDDLPGQLGSSFVEVTAVPVIASDGGSGVTANSMFVGSTPGTSILSGTDGHLHYDSIICVEVVVELDPNTPDGLDSLKNQAIVSGDPTFPDGAPVVINGMPMPAQVDTSDSGLIPDSTNPDDPGDLGTESDSTLLWLPGINLSKGLVNVEQVSDPINSPSTAGNVIATFKYTVKNTGNTTLNHVELSDDLINQLGGIFVQIDSIGEPMGLGIGVLHNAAWNGDTDTTLISSGQLLPNDSFMISVFLELNPNALSPVVPPTNQAHVEATPWDTLTMDTLTGVSGKNLPDVQDSSDSGILPESQNFGAPGDSGGSNDPTLVYLPNVNLSKEVTRFQLLMAPPDAVGNFAVTYQFKIKNTGNVPLDSLTLYDNIFDQYGGVTGAFARVRPDSMVRILDDGGTSILANPDFDGGVTDSALTIPLIGPGGSLQPDSTICVQVTLEINPNAMNLPNDPLLNQAIVDARPDDGMGNGLPGPDGLLLEMISDLSDSGTDPEDVNDDAFLADPGYTNDSTALQLSDLNITKEIIAYESNYNDTLPGDARMRFAVRIKNKGNIPINNVVVYDDIEEEFGAAFKEILEQPVYFVEENPSGSMPAVINPVMGMNLPGDSVLFTADALQPNVQMRIEFEIRIDPNAVGRPIPLLNQASVEGEAVVGGIPVMLMDISDSGSDPESSNPDALGDTGGENDPTLAPAPSINLAKTIPFPGVRIGSRPKNLIVTHILRIKNTGNVTLDSLRLNDPVGDAEWYGKWGAFVRIPTTPMILHQPSDGLFEINPDFDGLSLGDSEVLLPSADRSDSIPVNDSLVIKVEVEINTEVVPHDQDSILLNQAVAYGTGLLPDGSRREQEDGSDSGVDPESNNETDPLRLSQDLADIGHNDPTPLPNCFWCPTPCLDEVNTSFDENCQADIVEIMKGALRGVQPICVDLGFFDFEIKNEFGGLVSNPVSGENVKDEQCFKVSANNILCPYDPCWTNVCLKRFDTPIFKGKKTTVYCGDPLIDGPDPFEERFAIVSCQGQIPATFTGDWANVFDCEPGVQDTVKIIYREYEATSNVGFRGTGYDTICVLRLPEISVDNIYCPPMDTTYCGVGDRIGPYMVVDGIDGAGCERLYFLNPDGTAAEFDAKCGLSIHVEKFDFPSAGCINQTRYDVQVYQSCYGASVNQNCTSENSAGPHFEVSGGSGDAVILSCSFWVMDFDTTAPVVECRLEELGKVEEVNGVDAVVIEATSNDCSTASASLPPVSVFEACGTVKLVKARLEGVGTFIYRFNPSTGLFETDEVVDLPLRDEPYELIFEGVDDCHNIGQDRCYLIVQDPIIPVAVAHKGLTLSLGSKKVWLAAEDLDNGSYDNCNLNIVLARRTDWLTACVDLCDSLVVDHVTTNGDTVWCIYLSDDRLNDEVERSYRETVEWLNE